MAVFIECGQCGGIHPEDFFGDCRDDANRLTLDDLKPEDKLITIEEQMMRNM
jgi:hypothetical protein